MVVSMMWQVRSPKARQKKIAPTTPPKIEAVAFSLDPSLLFAAQGLLEGPFLKSQADFKSPATAR